MNKMKKCWSAVMALVMGASLLVPAAPAQAAEPQALPFPVYVNGAPVTIQNAILYNNFTYVQLRDLARVTNMGVDFNDPNMPYGVQPGGSLPIGINIDQPTFVYTKTNVPDWIFHKGATVDKAVDVTTIYTRYLVMGNNPTKDMKYYFHTDNDGKYFIARDQKGRTIKKQVHVFNSMGRFYVDVDEFRSIIQPYLVDMCMQ
jgi:hypothetical protein